MVANDEDLATAEQLRWGVSRLASRLRAEHLGSAEPLTRLSASVLANLKHRGPLAISELASIEGVQAQSLTRVVQELERQGRVARSRSAVDKRRQDIVVTEVEAWRRCGSMSVTETPGWPPPWHEACRRPSADCCDWPVS